MEQLKERKQLLEAKREEKMNRWAEEDARIFSKIEELEAYMKILEIEEMKKEDKKKLKNMKDYEHRKYEFFCETCNKTYDKYYEEIHKSSSKHISNQYKKENKN